MFVASAMDLKNAYDLATLAYVLDCSARQLGYYVYSRDLSTQYKQFQIKKKSGGTRTIRAPATNLKIIQKSIARELSKIVRFKPCVTGFVEGRDIKRNASIHVGQKHVLNIDLTDFFGTINYGRVYGLLTKKPHNIGPKVAAAIAKACTLDNVLPQGAPTSPILSNLVCAKMDAELNRYPNHFAARPVRVEAGKLLRTFSKSAVAYLEISSKILGGNSGGPVLDDKHQVVGIAVLGTGGSTEITSAEFLAVSSTEINALLS